VARVNYITDYPQCEDDTVSSAQLSGEGFSIDAQAVI
jgi:hypothetical protein